MRQVTVRLFGALELSDGTDTLLSFPTRRARKIFAFLALHRGRYFPRSVLCGIFWRDSPEEVARKGLRTTLWRMRRAFDPGPADPDRVVHSEGTRVGISGDVPLWVDVGEFEKSSDDHSSESLERAARLYRGDLLVGFYDDWCCEERERLRLDFLRVLERLMAHHQRRGEWRRAVARGLELLRRDELLEHVHRELMRCHYAMGNRPAAIRQYRECVRVLERELDIGPMDETRALFERIEAERSLPVRRRRWPAAREPGGVSTGDLARGPAR